MAKSGFKSLIFKTPKKSSAKSSRRYGARRSAKRR